jgi:hypothetical protein
MRISGDTDLQQLYRNRFGHDRETRSALWAVLVQKFSKGYFSKVNWSYR